MEQLAYGDSLYKDNPLYECHTFLNREDWLNGRKNLRGIGGSDSSAAIGQNKWKSNRQLWLDKTGRSEKKPEEPNQAMRYGTMAEEHIRRLYQLDTEEKYEVQYRENTILKSKQFPFMLYSTDGLLIEKETGRTGVLEIKTATLMSGLAKAKWEDSIPQSYFIQVLHGMVVTGALFVELRASLKYSDVTTV